MAEGQTLAVARGRSDEDLTTLIGVRRRVNPEASPTLELLRHYLQTRSEAVYLLARLDGEPAGCAFAGGRLDGGGMQAGVDVVPEARRRGVGSVLLRAISDHARAYGAAGFVIEAPEEDVDSQRWLERRGYEEIERQKTMVLDLTALEPPAPEPPTGVEIVTRAERPDLVPAGAGKASHGR